MPGNLSLARLRWTLLAQRKRHEHDPRVAAILDGAAGALPDAIDPTRPLSSRDKARALEALDCLRGLISERVTEDQVELFPEAAGASGS